MVNMEVLKGIIVFSLAYDECWWIYSEIYALIEER